MRWVFQTDAGPQTLALAGKLVVDNSETYIAAGLAGLGIMQGLDLFLQPWLKSGELVEVLPNNPVPSRKLSLIYPHRHVSRKVRVFAEWLATLL